MVDIQDGQTINIGKPDGPRMTFEVGHHQGAVDLLPATETFPVIVPPVFDMAMLAALTVVYLGIVRWRIRLKR